MPFLEYDFKTNITLIATYLPLAGLLLTFVLAKNNSGKTKWAILTIGPVFIFILMCLVWGFWTSKVIFRRITDPFYIVTLLFFLYLVGHYTYLLKRLVIFLLRKNKAN